MMKVDEQYNLMMIIHYTIRGLLVPYRNKEKISKCKQKADFLHVHCHTLQNMTCKISAQSPDKL